MNYTFSCFEQTIDSRPYIYRVRKVWLGNDSIYVLTSTPRTTRETTVFLDRYNVYNLIPDYLYHFMRYTCFPIDIGFCQQDNATLLRTRTTEIWFIENFIDFLLLPLHYLILSALNNTLLFSDQCQYIAAANNTVSHILSSIMKLETYSTYKFVHLSKQKSSEVTLHSLQFRWIYSLRVWAIGVNDFKIFGIL